MTTSVSGTRTGTGDPGTVNADEVDTSILGDPSSVEDAGATPQFDVRR
jgi:hypothetical protein